MLDDKADLGDGAGHCLADQIHLAELLDPGAGLLDLIGGQYQPEQIAGVDQADQHDVARIGYFVGQQDLAQPRLDLALLGVVDDRVAPGRENP